MKPRPAALQAAPRSFAEQAAHKPPASLAAFKSIADRAALKTRPVVIALAALACVAAWPVAAAPFDCVIEPHQSVDLRSPVDGLIDQVLVRRGDRVRSGQTLVVLDSAVEASAVEVQRFRAEMEGRVAVAQRRLDFATRKAERMAELQAESFMAAQARDEAEAEMRIAQAELRDAQDARVLAARELKYSQDLLAQRTLKSPFNGVVVDRMLNPGDLAEAGTGRRPVLRLAQVEPLRVEVVLPVAAWGQLRVGGKATVTPETLGGRYNATISVVDSVFDAASGTFGVRLELGNAQGRLPAGIRCQVEFEGLKLAPRTPVAGAVESRKP